MPQYQQSIRERVTIDEPDMYDVVFINDDFTTMEFVVMVLRRVFYMTEVTAEAVMLKVHHNGEAVVGTFTLDIARSKVAVCTRMARDNGYPLRLEIRKH